MRRVTGTKQLDDFKNALQNMNWDNVYKTTDVNKAYNNFVNNYTDLYDMYCPVKKLKEKSSVSSKPWFTQGLANACKKKNQLYKMFLHCRSDLKLAKYKRYKNKLTGILRCEEKRYYRTKVVYFIH